MYSVVKAALGSAAVAVFAVLCVPANAADLGGSLKDGYIAPMPVVHRPAGPCYLRADAGYSISQTPQVNWLVTDDVTGEFITDDVTNVSMENTWLGEVGVGCGSGSRGLRGEFTYSYRGKRDIDGEPGLWDPIPLDEDPLHTNVESHTLMFNAFYDLGRYYGFVPYVGAGIGVSFNKTGYAYFTENPNLVNTIDGASKTSFAWAVMAGVGYQISDRMILDFGYRFIDLGQAKSGYLDNAGYVNPRVYIDDLYAHEIKVGLRYHFGGRDNCCQYAMK
ncbi:putative heat resistant agglutinin 1 protein [Candidatus Filomicrobium marinum]|uniref:Opacity protein n=2 Tax=Filomicrobium TaxID=119044 RepID=A0A1H0QVC8_9HYPH|nr:MULTISPECIES: outer membrane beta-barrel protein [Filomicrobium]MCV0369503.1 outer membrane beta-barrel protein [Filomicrobium sp.]CFX44247.1 putative heat resistant agglutinin 1 protein [Candidatus Filomicrobium marinum]CPR20886.1 putative heat resistant agglutinin 1 protein [Candidatus Filomicrobium marinum]SDP20678.1 Opacity protein [Filomicrobium insigne]